MDPKLHGLANSYIGRIAKVEVKADSWKSMSGQEFSIDTVRFLDEELRKEWDEHFPKYRIILQGCVYTQDFNPNRVNFKVETTGLISRVYTG